MLILNACFSNSSRCTIPIISRLKVLHTWVSKKPEKLEKKPEPELSGRGRVRFQFKSFQVSRAMPIDKPESSGWGGFRIFSGFCTLYSTFYWNWNLVQISVIFKSNFWIRHHHAGSHAVFLHDMYGLNINIKFLMIFLNLATIIYSILICHFMI